MAVACDRYQCAGYTVLNSNEQQPDGYEITGSIPNTTISCTFISEDNYMIYYYTARALGNGQLMHEVVPAISSAAVQNLSLMVGLTIGLGLIVLLSGITIAISYLVYFYQQRLTKIVNANESATAPELTMRHQKASNLAKKGNHEHLKSSFRKETLLQDTSFRLLM